MCVCVGERQDPRHVVGGVQHSRRCSTQLSQSLRGSFLSPISHEPLSRQADEGPPPKCVQLKTFQGLLPSRQGQNLAVSELCLPHSLDSCSAYLVVQEVAITISSGRVFYDKHSGSKKLLHSWIISIIVKQNLVQSGRTDGPTENLS